MSSRYVEDEYVPDYRITVDLDFSQKKLRLSPDRQLNLQASKVCLVPMCGKGVWVQQ